MKRTHFLSAIRETPGYGRVKGRKRAVGLCGQWTSLAKATKDQAKVDCRDCQKLLATYVDHPSVVERITRLRERE